MANIKTFDVDKLFVRDIVFKDPSNRPISANQYLLTRGDGGIYFDNPNSSNRIDRGFNNFCANDMEFIASNYSNTLWFNSGPNIQFYSSIEGLQPKFWIATTTPEQLSVVGNSTMRFENIRDDISGGRTLIFEARNELNIFISDNKVVFENNNLSTLSTLASVRSTTESLYANTSTLTTQVSTVAGNVVTMLISSAVSTFYSTLITSEKNINKLSTFVHSTFEQSTNFLKINYSDIYISSLTVDNFSGPLVSSFSTINWSSAIGESALINTIQLSTITGNMNIPIITFDNENQRIGINLGDTPPRTTVDISGYVYADEFLTSSDPRLKMDRTLLYASSDDVLNAYRFKWLADGTDDIGVMADEVEQILPECVHTDKYGYKSVNYSKMVTYCLALIRDLNIRITELESNRKYNN